MKSQVATTFYNLLIDYRRKFFADVNEVYLQFRYGEVDYLPEWKAPYCREKHALDFVQACKGHFSEFMDKTLPEVEEYCSGIKTFYEEIKESLYEKFTEFFINVVNRRKEIQPNLVLGRSLKLTERLLGVNNEKLDSAIVELSKATMEKLIVDITNSITSTEAARIPNDLMDTN